MKDLIEALTIFAKYTDKGRVVNCEHDQMFICIDPALVTEQDTTRLTELSFHKDNSGGYFWSYRFGSC